jgi:phospholipid/cholesterol/gamma-HCH transport system substrate-binding protein
MSPRIGRRARDPRAPRVLRKDRKGANPVRVGALIIAVVAIGSYFGFTKHIPFTHGFQLKAVFQSAVNMRTKSPVRIAGVNVGVVTGVSHYPNSNAALVTMDLQQDALPIHADATLKIRPRIFLEGNFFVDMQPGSPSAPTLHAGATIPITQTSDPVQVDQVLSALNSDTRSDLQAFLAGYGTALTHVPTPAENVGQDPLVHGKTAAQALNQSYHFAPQALRNSAIIGQAFVGSGPHDLSKLVASLGRVSAALALNESSLQGLISNLDTTLAAFASQSGALQTSIGLLPGALSSAQRGFAALNAALPATRAFSLALIPAVRQTPALIAAAEPWITQANLLVGPSELGALAPLLDRTAQGLGALVPSQTTFARTLGNVSRCLSKVILPTGNIRLNDGPLSANEANYKELWNGLVGSTGEAQNSDGNGAYIHYLVSGGGQTVTMGPARILGSSDKGANVYARTPLPFQGTSPAYPGVVPPYKSSVQCYTQALPDLNGPLAHGPADGSGAAAPAAAPRATTARGGLNP